MNTSFEGQPVTSDNRTWISPNITVLLNYDFYHVNIVTGFMAIFLNIAIVIIFIMSKELRTNLFYRLLIPINIFHCVAGCSAITHTFLSEGNAVVACRIMFVLGVSSRLSSISQISVVSVDRYQASQPLPKSVLLRRRQKLGFLSIGITILMFLVTSIIVGIDTEFYPCESFQSNRPSSDILVIIVSLVTVICIFAVEIPFSALTFHRLRKSLITVGVKVRFNNDSSAARNTSSDRGIRIENYPTPTLQKNHRLKLRALKTVVILMSTHAVIFVAQVILVNIARVYSQDSFVNYFIFLSLLNYFCDALICICTVQPIQTEIKKVLSFCKTTNHSS